jgi:hypothetical protein
VKCPYRIDTYYLRDSYDTGEPLGVAKEIATRSVQEFGICYGGKCPYYSAPLELRAAECTRVKEGKT